MSLAPTADFSVSLIHDWFEKLVKFLLQLWFGCTEKAAEAVALASERASEFLESFREVFASMYLPLPLLIALLLLLDKNTSLKRAGSVLLLMWWIRAV